MVKLFVVGFPRAMDELQLAQLFGPHGDIEMLTIVRDQFTRESKGFGFIQMKTESGASEAIHSLDGKTFGDRQIEVRLADQKQIITQNPVKPTYQPGPKLEAPQKRKRPRINK